MVSSWDATEELATTSAAILSMERAGVYLDRDVAAQIERDALAEESAQLNWLDDFNVRTGWFDLDSPREQRDGLWASHPQLAAFLYSPLGLNLPESPYHAKGKTKPGDYCTDHAAIEFLSGAYPEHRDFLSHVRALRRARSCLKYARKFPGFINDTTGLVHPVFGAASDSDQRVGALSGRLACKLPELHQVPRDPRKDVYRLRRMFSTRPGETLVVADYSALEVVVLAQIAKWLFNDDSLARKVAPGAPDIHGTTAHELFSRGLRDPVAGALTVDEFVRACGKAVDVDGHVLPAEWPMGKELPPRPSDWPEQLLWSRQAALKYCGTLRDITKTIRYGLHYGKGAWGFGNTLFTAAGDSLGEQRAGEMVDAFLAAEPGLGAYYRWVDSWIREHAGIPSLLGRWCDLRELVHGDDWQFKRAWRRALNYPMQAGAADLVNRAMSRVCFDPELRAAGWTLILQVHDELILRGPEDSADWALGRVCAIMSAAGESLMPGRWTLPLQVSAHTGKNWNDAK